MPNINWTQFYPMSPWNWTTIVHYLLLVGAVAMVFTSGAKASNLYILIIAAFALVVGTDLYIDRLALYRFFVFIIRVAMVGVPLIIAGIAPTDANRTLGGIAAFLAVLLLLLTFFNCFMPPFMQDPRIVVWCY